MSDSANGIQLTGGDKGIAALQAILKKIGSEQTLRVGFLEGATYPNGTPVAMVAAIQEYGAPAARIPARSFFRTMIAAKSPQWGQTLAALLRANKLDAAKALDQMGMGIAGQLQQSIVSTDSPPLSEVTVMLRKMRRQTPGMTVTGRTVAEAVARVRAGESTAGVSSTPLQDTGYLLSCVSYQVKGQKMSKLGRAAAYVKTLGGRTL